MTSDLSSERSLAQKYDAERQSVERQNKDLKTKLAELESSVKTRGRAQVAALEAKVANLDEQLTIEGKLVF